MTTLNTQPLQPLQPKKKFILIDELLPDTTQRRSITTEAHRVYTGIWNKLNRYPSDAIWIKNDQLSIMARVSPENLDKALSELSSAGLLEIKVGMVQNQYRIISLVWETNCVCIAGNREVAFVYFYFQDDR